jgi:hypothetical protein
MRKHGCYIVTYKRTKHIIWILRPQVQIQIHTSKHRPCADMDKFQAFLIILRLEMLKGVTLYLYTQQNRKDTAPNYGSAVHKQSDSFLGP